MKDGDNIVIKFKHMNYNDIQLITYDGGETWIDVSPSIILNEIKYERK